MTSDIPSPAGKDAREAFLGWHAHADTDCARCGGALGPYHFSRWVEQEFWGCSSCGIGVCFGEHGQPDINAAADKYVAMVSTKPRGTRA